MVVATARRALGALSHTQVARLGAWYVVERLHRGILGRLFTEESPACASGGPWGETFSPRSVQEYNPVLTAGDVTDFGRVEYVADPFGCRRDRWYVFFEMYNGSREPDAVIGYATSGDGYDWKYGGIALETTFHLSFPFVFEHDGRWFMTPEQEHPDGPRISLFESADDSFAEGWVESTVLLEPDHQARDPVVFEYDDRWWLLVADTPTDELYLYSASEPTATDWRPHPENPIGTHGPRAARPGGRPLVSDDCVTLFYQDCKERYGHAVRAFEVTELTDEAFTERETAYSPVVSPSSKHLGWNSGCMHTFDAHRDGDRWLCIVDGNIDFGHRVSDGHWSIGVYGSRGEGE